MKWPHRDWVTVSRHGHLTDDTILSAIALKEKCFWGCRWDKQSQVSVFDVDIESQYHNEIGLARLKHLLSSVGLLNPLLYQSSESEGWHIYLAFDQLVDSRESHDLFKRWLLAEGIEVRKGQLELFPSNNGLRLPLQRGFAWLDDQGETRFTREDISTDQAITTFVEDLDANSHDWYYVQDCIKRRLEAIESAAATDIVPPATPEQDPPDDGFSDFFTFAGMLPDVYNAGREFWLNGLTAPSQRHQAVLSIGHYLWYGDVAEGVRALPGVARAEQRAQVIEAWLREKHNGFSKSVLKGDWGQIGRDIQSACNWTPSEGAERSHQSQPSYSNLSDRAIDRLIRLTKQTGRVWCPDDFRKGNVGREEGAREQIRSGVLLLLENGKRVSVRALERVTGCDRKTIRRHVDIWGIFRLSNGGGDLRPPERPALFISIVPDLVQEAPDLLQEDNLVVPEVTSAPPEQVSSLASSILYVSSNYQQSSGSDLCFVITGRSVVHESLPKTRGPPAF